jgi:aflatoxin B1 aldehyde reductase
LETELIPCCRRYGIDVYIFNPLAGGFLSGKYKAGAAPAEGRFSDKLSSQGKMYRDRYFKSSLFDKLDDLKRIADQHGLTMVEIALRWCVHHSALNVNVGGGDGIITGFSSLAQLETNLTDLQKGPLPTEVVDALDSAWGQSQADSNNFWHGKLEYGYDTTKVLFGA